MEEAKKAMEEGRRSRIVEEDRVIMEEKEEPSPTTEFMKRSQARVEEMRKSQGRMEEMRRSRVQRDEDELTRQIRVASRF